MRSVVGHWQVGHMGLSWCHDVLSGGEALCSLVWCGSLYFLFIYYCSGIVNLGFRILLFLREKKILCCFLHTFAIRVIGSFHIAFWICDIRAGVSF